MRIEEAKLNIKKKLHSMVQAEDTMTNAFLFIHSDANQIDWNMAVEKGKGNTLKDSDAHRPYHIASINKTMIAAIICMLVEDGKVSFSDPISTYLEEDLLNNLHMYKENDYSSAIQIHHLLGHTSGLPDYISTKPKEGKTYLEQVLDDPTKFRSVNETMTWAKEQFDPLFPPGEKCHYTDTGFNLLLHIIENITAKPFEEVVHHYIFKPLQMDHTYLSLRSTPAVENANDPLNIFKDGIELDPVTYPIFAGQTVSTSSDLLTFMNGLISSKLMSKESFQQMKQWSKLWIGVDYGYGLMRVRPVPFLKKYHLWGHLGSTSSYMLYNPTYDIYFIGNFNHFGMTTKTVRFVFNALRNITKAVEK